MSRLSQLRQIDTSSPEALKRDLGRLVEELEGTFRGLREVFLERWLPARTVVTSTTERPGLKFGEFTKVDTQGGDVRLYLPLATGRDAGRVVQFVKMFAANWVRVVAAAGTLVNMETESNTVNDVGLHEFYWDGEAWWRVMVA